MSDLVELKDLHAGRMLNVTEMEMEKEIGIFHDSWIDTHSMLPEENNIKMVARISLGEDFIKRF